MDANLINPFIDATLNVLGTMASTKAEHGKPYLKKDKVARGDVTGVIGMTGETNGTISVSFTENSILAIASNMFGEEIKELNEEIKDAAGELTNMISGQEKFRGVGQDTTRGNTDGDHRQESYPNPHDNLPHNRHSL